MKTHQKILLVLLLAAVVLVILTTWGSIGSSVLTLALLLSIGFLLMKWGLNRGDPYDYQD